MRISDWSSDVCSSDLRVGKAPHRPGADRPHHEADGKDGRGAQKLRGRIGLGEKDRREIDGEGGIGEPVVPFDQIARRSADYRQPPSARYRLNLHDLRLPARRSAQIRHNGESRDLSSASLTPADSPSVAVVSSGPRGVSLTPNPNPTPP